MLLLKCVVAAKVIQPGVALGIELLVFKSRKLGPIAVRAKNHVYSSALVVGKERIYVLPHHFLFLCDLEESSVHALTDKSVSVGQALRAADVAAKEIPRRACFVAPLDPVCLGIDFDDSRSRRPGMTGAVHAVVEDQNVSVFDRSRAMLVSKLAPTPLPLKPAALFVYDRNGIQSSKAGQDVSVG